MQRLVKNHTNTVNTARQISYTCTLLVPLHKITIRSNRRAQQQRVLPATVEMDVHREGGRREDDDGDVVVDATRTMRRGEDEDDSTVSLRREADRCIQEHFTVITAMGVVTIQF